MFAKTFKSRLRLAPFGLMLCAAVTAVAVLEAATIPAIAEDATQAGPPTLRRLSEDEYKRSIAQIFGLEINVPGRFEPSVREDGLLAIGQSHVVVTPSGLEQYALRAREISA